MGFGSGRGFGIGGGRGYGYGRGLGKGKGGVSGFSCIKYMFFGFNVFFWLLGCAILGIGIWLQVSKGSYASLSSSFNFLSATVLCIITGVLILLIGFFGCCGAIMENRCLLVTYFILVAVIFILEIVAATLLFVYRFEIEDIIATELKNGIEKKYNMGGDDNDGLKETWALIQSEMKCCGVYNYSDWRSNPEFKNEENQVPRECCRDNSTCSVTRSEDWYQKGCFPELKAKLKENLYVVGIITICIIVLQVLGLVASMTLTCLKRDKYYDE